MTKIPDSIRRKAEDAAMEDQGYPDKDHFDEDGYSAFVGGYLMCYQHLTKGKPDGWCGWHPEKGWWCECSEGAYPEIFPVKEDATEFIGSFYLNQGYIIVPVKLIEMEEPSDDK